MTSQTRPPVHESLHVSNSKDIYRNDEWWKAIVRYTFDQDADSDEVAVYLWHNDDGWTRKNKYVIKTVEAWETDKTIIETFLSDSAAGSPDEEFPVSDYYELAAGETIFQSDGWWKAIVKISQKGSYETEEVMVYLWQEADGDWRRRQKYTIKSEESWADEKAAIESILDIDTASDAGQRVTDNTTSGTGSETLPEEFKQLSREIDKHLSDNPVE